MKYTWFKFENGFEYEKAWDFACDKISSMNVDYNNNLIAIYGDKSTKIFIRFCLKNNFSFNEM